MQSLLDSEYKLIFENFAYDKHCLSIAAHTLFEGPDNVQ